MSIMKEVIGRFDERGESSEDQGSYEATLKANQLSSAGKLLDLLESRAEDARHQRLRSSDPVAREEQHIKSAEIPKWCQPLLPGGLLFDSSRPFIAPRYAGEPLRTAWAILSSDGADVELQSSAEALEAAFAILLETEGHAPQLPLISEGFFESNDSAPGGGS